MSRSFVLFSAAVITSVLFLGGITTALSQPGPSSPSNSPSDNPTATPPSGAPSAGASGSITLSNELSGGILINFLHHLNNVELFQANNALARLENEQARTYAQDMITEHQQNDQQISQLASTKGIPIYAFQFSTVDIANNAELALLNGPEFDLSYMQLQLINHQKALQDLTQIQGLITDPELSDLITQVIPVIQTHITDAITVINGLAGASPSPGTSASPGSSPSSFPGASPTSSPDSSPTFLPGSTSTSSPSGTSGGSGGNGGSAGTSGGTGTPTPSISVPSQS
jgi:predicted outer membrane protein